MKNQTINLIKSLVVNMQLSKQLHDLGGIPEKAIFFWNEGYERGDGSWVDVDLLFRDELLANIGFPAYTSAQLTKYLQFNLVLVYNEKADDNDKFRICNIAFKDNKFIESTSSETEADCKAKMLIQILESKSDLSGCS